MNGKARVKGIPRASLRPRAAATLALVVLASCSRASHPGGEGKSFESNAGHFLVTVVPSRDPIPRGVPFDVTVTVVPKGPAAGPIDVLIDARMPEHFHGMNRLAQTRRQSATTWLGQGLLFHMPGHWELDVDISREGTTERAQWDLELR